MLAISSLLSRAFIIRTPAIWEQKSRTLEDEKHVFNVPSWIIIPAGLQHGPIITRSVEKPFGFYMVRLDKGDPSDINPA
jgi:hypothetical protein